MNKEEYIEHIRKTPVNLYEIQQAMGDLSRLVSIMEKVRNIAIKEGAEKQKKTDKFLFEHILKTLIVEEKIPSYRSDEAEYVRGRKQGEVSAHNDLAKKIKNKIEKIFNSLTEL